MGKAPQASELRVLTTSLWKATGTGVMKMQLQPLALQGQQQLKHACSTGEGGGTPCTSATNPTAPSTMPQDKGTSPSMVVDEKVTFVRLGSK